MNKRLAAKVLPALLGTALFAAAGSAAAATTSTTVNVTASVNAVCNMQSSTAIAFGPIAAFTTSSTTATGNVTLQCNKGATVTLGVSNGNNFSASGSGLREMKSGTSDYIPYHIFQPTNATFSDCTGASTEWTSAISVSSLWATSGGPNTISLCGSVDPAPSGGYAVGASYLDVVTVTATYP